MSEYSEFLKRTILQAGAIAMDYRKNLKNIGVESKNTSKDIVTEADKAVERFIREELAREYPEHAITGEEEGASGDHEYRWIIDPIDGTVSYLHEQPFFAVSIALSRREELILGAVYAPVLDELFFAEKGAGAVLNGEPIHVSREDQLDQSVVATGFICLRDNHEKNNLPAFNAVAPRVRGVRRFGAASLDLCYVAAGRLEAYWESNLNIYDIAAGALILKEAGGMVTNYDGSQTGIPEEMIATNGAIHKSLCDLVRPCWR
jgi:myo-inositol-1(or 4)-monophosphatase